MTEKLLAWFDRARRDLPWRHTKDLYRVWVSEVMLQQTRVESVIPYYNHFVKVFPDFGSLASAADDDVMTAWSGLGFYARGRRLHAAARLIVNHRVPSTYQEIRELPGVGDYTAAALASICLGQPFAAVDGNVTRVISRLTNGETEIQEVAQSLLDPARPGDFNEAMMDLGATICVPLNPRCHLCPVAADCAALAAGTQNELPVREPKTPVRRISLDLALIEENGLIFLMRRPGVEQRLAGFWELPERRLFPRVRGTLRGTFTHQIVNDRFAVKVWKARRPGKLPEGSA